MNRKKANEITSMEKMGAKENYWMKTVRWGVALLAFAALAGLTGCAMLPVFKGEAYDSGIRLEKPKYLGESEKYPGYPAFEFRWSKVKGYKSYTLNIELELDHYAESKGITVFDGKTKETVTLLYGIDTDTATYYVKVKPEWGKMKPTNTKWSNIWKIDFVDGEYTVSAYEEPDESPDEEPDEEAVGIVEEIKEQIKEQIQGGDHKFPESLSDFLSKEKGQEQVDLSKAVSLTVNVNHSEYGEPTQRITDEATVRAAAEAAEQITVTGEHDGVGSTGTYYAYTFYDEEDESLASFSIQDGKLMGRFGRYPITGAETLLHLDGIIYDWDSYWEGQAEKEREYEENENFSLPASCFQAGGYETSRIEKLKPSDILSVSINLGVKNEKVKNYTTRDTEEIARLLQALKQVRAIKEVRETSGQMWSVVFTYIDPSNNFEGGTYLGFHGSFLDGGERAEGYETEGLDDFFDAVDADIAGYLMEYREERLPKAIY